MNEVYIVSIARTPIGSFGGSLASVSAINLAAIAVKKTLEKVNVDSKMVDEFMLGNVISAGLGQAPARQVAIAAGLEFRTPCTTINKVCASGMKSIMLGAESIMLGINDVVIAAGAESMSNIPYYLFNARFGYKLGNGEIMDGISHDGLTDPINHSSMGSCADNTAKVMGISRQEQDSYAISSYKRTELAWKSKQFANEIVPVVITDKKGTSITISEDEEYKKVQFEKIPNLKPVFSKDGTATAANSSTLNDGAAAVLLMSGKKLKELGVKPLVKIRGFADASQEPIWFTTSPALAIPKAMAMAGIEIKDVNYYEINEAFATVAIANIQKLGLDFDRVNINGGAIAIGHPLGMSGTRITLALANILEQKNQSIGVAGICNGGGGASAIVLEKV